MAESELSLEDRPPPSSLAAQVTVGCTVWRNLCNRLLATAIQTAVLIDDEETTFRPRESATAGFLLGQQAIHVDFILRANKH
jgi:hypothetical protein